MIEEVVRVSRIEQGEIWIEANRQSACASCSSKQSCGQGTLSEWGSGNSVQLPVTNPTGLHPDVGQQVVVGLEEASLVKASLMIYLVPLLALVVLALVARALDASEGWQVLAGGVGLALGFLLVRVFSKSDSVRNGCYQPVLLRLS